MKTVNIGPINMDEFINTIAPRLPFKPTIVRMEKTYMLGSELKLTGVKDYKGQPIEDDKAYAIDLPVYEGRMENDEPVIKSPNHREELRKAYLMQGLNGIYGYLKPYLSEPSLNKVKAHFMRVNK